MTDREQAGLSVVEMIERSVARSPGRVAVRAPDGVLTYSELWQRSERIARRLIALGVRPGDLVGECVERSASLVVAVLAIARAGAAYVAIDPAYPDERVRWMLDDAGVTAVVSDVATAGRLGTSDTTAVVVMGAAGEIVDGPEGDDPLPAAPRGTALAYVVYTSGSTGLPKGVMVEHDGLMNLVTWHRDAFALVAGDRCTQIASPGFDATVWEIWPSLAGGATIHVVPEDLRGDPLALRDWLAAEGITVSFLPTPVAEAVIGLAWPASTAMRVLLTGGDALTRRPPATLPFTLVNNYGLSETAVVATSGPVAAAGDGPPSIGRAISGVVAEVVDDELILGGVAVARGYLHRPELTDERFFTDDRGRWFRTGDRVRIGADGAIEFLGRVDDQLSIRGFRVEPGEVSAALNAHPAIEASVAVASGRTSADRKLVAYVVATGDERPDDRELSARLAASLPEYMVPARYVWLDELPVTAHGKIDRGALPEPPEHALPVAVGRGPQTPVEETTAAVLAELLELDEIGMDQNFFLLGGHSMLGAQLIVRVDDLFGVEISLRYLFDNPTPAAIAAEVERQLAQQPAGDLVSR